MCDPPQAFQGRVTGRRRSEQSPPALGSIQESGGGELQSATGVHSVVGLPGTCLAIR
jgi:hypothetical protein